MKAGTNNQTHALFNNSKPIVFLKLNNQDAVDVQGNAIELDDFEIDFNILAIAKDGTERTFKAGTHFNNVLFWREIETTDAGIEETGKSVTVIYPDNEHALVITNREDGKNG